MTTQRILDTKQKIEEMKAKLVEEGRIEFLSCAAEFFTKHPTVEKIGWAQYTPYFNDGEECIFRVNDYDYMIQMEGQEEPVWEYDVEEDADPTLDEDYKKYFKAMFDALGDEAMKTLFGDHVLILVNRNGTIETQEYSHD